jgi:hypothetical protein
MLEQTPRGCTSGQRTLAGPVCAQAQTSRSCRLAAHVRRDDSQRPAVEETAAQLHTIGGVKLHAPTGLAASF